MKMSKIEKTFGVNPNNIAELISGSTSEPEYFTMKTVKKPVGENAYG